MEVDFVTLVCVGVGVLQVPLLMDILDNAFPQLGIGRATRAGLSKVLFALLSGFCLVALYYFFTTFLPLYVERPFERPLGLAHIVCAVWMWVNAVGHYILASSVSPGIAPRADDSTPSDAKTCRKCTAVKGPLVHHCNACGYCVRAMDHHCPFTMNCVGLRNFFHYFLFLAYGSSGLIYGSVLSWRPFYLCWIADGADCPLRSTASLLFMPAFFICLSGLGLLAFHVLLLLTNMTTVDCLVCLRNSSVSTLVAAMRDTATRPDSKLRTLLLVGRPAWHWLVPVVDRRYPVREPIPMPLPTTGGSGEGAAATSAATSGVGAAAGVGPTPETAKTK